MELKSGHVQLRRAMTVSFNRTAYGIEICLNHQILPGFVAFNRTAYGIEIQLVYKFRHKRM